MKNREAMTRIYDQNGLVETHKGMLSPREVMVRVETWNHPEEYRGFDHGTAEFCGTAKGRRSSVEYRCGCCS